jgi:hypothetical protein
MYFNKVLVKLIENLRIEKSRNIFILNQGYHINEEKNRIKIDYFSKVVNLRWIIDNLLKNVINTEIINENLYTEIDNLKTINESLNNTATKCINNLNEIIDETFDKFEYFAIDNENPIEDFNNILKYNIQNNILSDEDLKFIEQLINRLQFNTYTFNNNDYNDADAELLEICDLVMEILRFCDINKKNGLSFRLLDILEVMVSKIDPNYFKDNNELIVSTDKRKSYGDQLLNIFKVILSRGETLKKKNR